jgi:hypothetical protein
VSRKKKLLELLCCGGLKRAFGGCLKRTLGRMPEEVRRSVLPEEDLKDRFAWRGSKEDVA